MLSCRSLSWARFVVSGVLAGFTMLAGAQQKIVAASDVGYQPFSAAKPSGGLEGIDIEIAQAMSKQIGIPIEIVDQSFSTVFAGLNAGKYDMVLVPATITKLRAEQYLFSQGYGDATYQFVMRKNRAPINSPEDLRNKVVSVNKGNLFDKWLTARQAQYGWTVNRFDKATDAVQAVASGQAEAALVHSAVAGYIAKQNPTLTTSKFLVNDGDVYGYAFRKSDRALRDKIDMALQCLKKSGALADIYRKWTGLEPLVDGVMVKASVGAGQPGFEGYDPTPSTLDCK